MTQTHLPPFRLPDTINGEDSSKNDVRVVSGGGSLVGGGDTGGGGGTGGAGNFVTAAIGKGFLSGEAFGGCPSGGPGGGSIFRDILVVQKCNLFTLTGKRHDQYFLYLSNARAQDCQSLHTHAWFRMIPATRIMTPMIPVSSTLLDELPRRTFVYMERCSDVNGWNHSFIRSELHIFIISARGLMLATLATRTCMDTCRS